MTLELLVLALGAMVSPAIFAAVLLILTRPRPRSLLLAFYLGALLTSVGIGVAVVTGLQQSGLLDGDIVSPALELTVGGLALLVAWALATGRTPKRGHKQEHKPADRDPWTDRILSRGSIPLAFAIGLLMNLPGGFYLIALKDVADSDPSFSAAFFRVLAFNAVMLLAIEAPLLGFLLAPERTAELAGRLGDWIEANGRRLVIGTAALMGLYLLGSGIGRLL